MIDNCDNIVSKIFVRNNTMKVNIKKFGFALSVLAY